MSTYQKDITQSNEDIARAMLIERYKDSYGAQVMEQAEILLSLDGYIDRFNYLLSALGQRVDDLYPSILVSGYAAGSEMIVARNFGFQEIYGVEVDASLFEIAKVRVANLPKIFPTIYNGFNLPYDDQQFNLVVSGHIIEHTESPKRYLKEVMRVLKSGGILYIEFPSRYHHTELHTGLFSFEWLPVIIRNLILHLISSNFSPLNPTTKSKYKTILSSRLKQVSRRDIFLLLRQLRVNYQEVAYSKPAPGIVRCIIQKIE